MQSKLNIESSELGAHGDPLGGTTNGGVNGAEGVTEAFAVALDDSLAKVKAAEGALLSGEQGTQLAEQILEAASGNELPDIAADLPLNIDAEAQQQNEAVAAAVVEEVLAEAIAQGAVPATTDRASKGSSADDIALTDTSRSRWYSLLPSGADRGGAEAAKLVADSGVDAKSTNLAQLTSNTAANQFAAKGNLELQLAQQLNIGTQKSQVSSETNLAGVTTSLSSGAKLANTTSQPADLSLQVGRQGWGDGVGQRILWMVNQRVQQAEIQLNPRDLGPLEVRVSLQDNQANVQFTSHHAAVREALEAALPRLREMLTDQGLQMQGGDIHEHSFAEQRRQSETTRTGHVESHADDQEGSSEEGQLVVTDTSLGLLDTYV